MLLSLYVHCVIGQIICLVYGQEFGFFISFDNEINKKMRYFPIFKYSINDIPPP